MILNEADFGSKVKKGYVVACLPQIEEDWCLAVKVDKTVFYLGDENGKESYFSTLDKAVEKARSFEAAQVLVITGAKPWQL